MTNKLYKRIEHVCCLNLSLDWCKRTTGNKITFVDVCTCNFVNF